MHAQPMPACAQAAAESGEALTDALSLAADKLIKVCSEHKMCVSIDILVGTAKPACGHRSAPAGVLQYPRGWGRHLGLWRCTGGWAAG